MSCPHLKVTKITKREVCLHPRAEFKFCMGSDCPYGLGTGTPCYSARDPYQSKLAERLLEGFFLGALEQTPGPDYE